MKRVFKELVGVSLICSMLGSSLSMAAPVTDAGEETAVIASDKMEVVVDLDFPRVIEYHMNGKTMYGQNDAIHQVKINNQLYTPEVTSEQNGDCISYDMYIEEIGVQIKADLAVSGNVLEFRVTEIIENGEMVKRFEIPEHGLLSVSTAQPGASELGIDVKGGVIYNNTSIEERNRIEDMAAGTAKTKTYLILNTDELAGAVITNAMNTYEWGTEPENRNISYANEAKIQYQVMEEGGEKILEASSYPWTYREYEEETMDLPYAKVVITDDINENGVVDWQDGAVAYREILPVPKMSEEAKKSFFHIAYTRASLAQWPFDKTLDMVKKLYLYTDGFGQFLQYKGYQAEGHDSNHPDYGDSFNEKVGGAEGLNNLATEALKYNCNVGVHLNHTEAYPEAKNYSYDLVTSTKGWDSLDLSMKIDRYKDSVNDGVGGLKYRLNQLKEAVPNLKWIYYDVYEAQGYAQWKLAKETMAPTENCDGFAVASEFQGALDPYTIWGHVQCQASPAMRIMRYNMTDQFFYDPILLESRHAGSMGYGDDGNQDQGTGGQTIPDQIDMFYNNNLLFKYMQNHDINETDMFGDEKRFFDEVYFDGNVTGRIIAQRDRTSGSGQYGTDETRQPIVELVEDGRLVARYQKKFQGKTTDATVNNSDSGSKKITPMMTQYLLPWDTNLENPVDTEQGTELYHYNSEGGTTDWELPESWKSEESVTIYELSDIGRIHERTLAVEDGMVSIEAEAGIPYIVCKAGNPGMPSAAEVDFGQNTVFSDPGFETKEFGQWEVTNPENAEILTSESSGETFVEVSGAEETTISQHITGLEPGKTYQLSVWAEVDGRTATLGIRQGDKEVTNDMLVSEIQNNYYNSLRYNDDDNKMQRLKLEFVAEGTDAEVFIRANEGKGTIDFDDFRMVERKDTEWAQDAPEDAVFFWDFEFANDEGWGPFVPVQNVNRAHLSETHMGYTSDTIDGKYSLKIRDSVGNSNKGEAVRTIGSNMRLENGKTYTIQFDYWMKSKEAYDVSVSAGYVPGHQKMEGGDKNNLFAEHLDYEKTAYSKTFTVPDDGREYGLSFFKNLTGKEELIVDNLALYEGEKALPESEVPTYDFDDMTEETSGKWVTALGNGFAEIVPDLGSKATENRASGAHLQVVSDRTESVFLDEDTNDITDGSIEFDVTGKEAYQFGIVARYIDSKNYLAFRYTSETDGWRYTSSVDGEKTDGILNMPGILLNAGRKQHISMSFEGNHYTLKADGITLFDGIIEGLREEGGRIGFITNSRTPVSVDNVLITGEQADEGTPIIPEGGSGQQEPGKFVTYSFDDAYVQKGSTSDQNFGTASSMKVKNDGSGNYWRQAYIKFPLPNTFEDAVTDAVMKLHLTKVGDAAGEEFVYVVSNEWSESTITADNAPEAKGEPVAAFDAQEGKDEKEIEIDLTDAVKAALAAGESSISLAIQHGEAAGGSTDIEIAAFEHTKEEFRPVLNVNYDAEASGIVISKNELVLGVDEEVQLEAQLIPDDPEAELLWESEDEEVAVVDESGLVTAVAPGVTSVTVSYQNLSAKCKVSVKNIEKFPAIEDTYVQDDLTAPKGDSEVLRLKNGIESYNRNIYLKFEVPQGKETDHIKKATVDVYFTEFQAGSGTETVSLIPVDPESWSESELTWENREEIPTSGAMKFSVYKESNVNQTYSMDITDYLKKAMEDGKTEISFVMKNTNNTSGCGFDIPSKEADENVPTLTVESVMEKEGQEITGELEPGTPSDAERPEPLPLPPQEIVPPTEESRDETEAPTESESETEDESEPETPEESESETEDESEPETPEESESETEDESELETPEESEAEPSDESSSDAPVDNIKLK